MDGCGVYREKEYIFFIFSSAVASGVDWDCEFPCTAVPHEFIKKASGFTGGHYPEKCAHIYIINVPKWFNFVWNVIKGFIDPVTRNKTHIIRGKGEVTAQLLEHIPARARNDLGALTSKKRR